MATYLFPLCFAFLFAGMQPEIVAQPYLGAVWDAPKDTAEANQQLETFSGLGFTYLELNHPVDSWILDRTSELEFTVLVRTDNSYLTVPQIKKQQDVLLSGYIDILERYRTHFNVAAIGLLLNSQTMHPEFNDSFSPILDSLNVHFNKSFYFYAHDAWFNFQYTGESFGTLYIHQNFQPRQLSSFNDRMQELISQESSQVLFLNSTWLLEAVEEWPELSISLKNYQESGIWKLPLPQTDAIPVSAHWLVFLLVSLWVALAVQFKYLPYMQPMLLRYFLAHRFFVDDILHYRERAATGGILLMLMHAIFGGIVFYVSAQRLISPTGLEALYHHMPFLAIAGSNYASFFFLGVMLIIITQIVAILWLYLPAKNLEHFSQSINLYAGLFFLDFIFVTLIVTLFMAGTGHTLIPILAVLFVIIWFFAFNIAAYNTSRNMGSETLIYLLLTIGLHTLVFIGLLILFFMQNDVIYILDLALSL